MFAQSRMVERNPVGERTLDRTRANVERCHCCHARLPTSSGWCSRVVHRRLNARLSGALLVAEVGRSQTLERHPERHVLIEPATEIMLSVCFCSVG